MGLATLEAPLSEVGISAAAPAAPAALRRSRRVILEAVCSEPSEGWLFFRGFLVIP